MKNLIDKWLQFFPLHAGDVSILIYILHHAKNLWMKNVFCYQSYHHMTLQYFLITPYVGFSHQVLCFLASLSLILLDDLQSIRVCFGTVELVSF